MSQNTCMFCFQKNGRQSIYIISTVLACKNILFSVICTYPICFLTQAMCQAFQYIFSNHFKSVLLFVDLFCYIFVFCVCLCYTIWFIPCSLVITCWEKDDLLALLCVLSFCVKCHFPIWCPWSCVILGCVDLSSMPSS